MFCHIKHPGLVGLLAGLLGWVPVWAVENGEAEQVPQLIRDLGSSQYGRREAAMRQLDSLGPKALAALRNAAQNEDLEVRRRSQTLVEQIEKRMEAARLLEPRRIHLVYKDTPVAAALADFSRKSGYSIQHLRGSLPADQTITLDTGDVTFWEALDQFCKKAGMVEQNRLAPTRPRRIPADADRLRWEQEVRLLLREEALGGINNVYALPATTNLALVNGQAPSLPTSHAGAVRIQALSPELCVFPVVKSPEQVQVVLEINAEPKLSWKKVVDVRIEKAVDDKGQPLELAARDGKPVIDHDLEMRVQAMLTGQQNNVDLFARGLRQIPVNLQVHQNYPQAIRELKGTVSGLVMTPPEVLVAIDDVLKSGGKTVRTKEGSDLKVVEARRDFAGQIRLQCELPGWFGRWGNEPVINRRARMGRMVMVNTVTAGQPVGTMSWAVQDAQGRRLSLTRMETQFNQRDHELVQENYLTFHTLQGQEGPFKLILTGQRLVILDVPFTLKDIPVP
jgi:hypothetical protein